MNRKSVILFYVTPTFRLTGSTINAIEYFLEGWTHNPDLKLILVNVAYLIHVKIPNHHSLGNLYMFLSEHFLKAYTDQTNTSFCIHDLYNEMASLHSIPHYRVSYHNKCCLYTFRISQESFWPLKFPLSHRLYNSPTLKQYQKLYLATYILISGQCYAMLL